MGWNGSGNYSKKAREARVSAKNRSGLLLKGLLAGGLVIVGGLVAVFVILGKGESIVSGPSEGQSKVHNPIATTDPDLVKQVAPETEPAPTTNANARIFGHSSNVPSSDTNRIHKATMDGIKVIGADGKEYSVRSQPIFKSRVDNMLWAAIRPGGMPSGLSSIRSRMRHMTGSDEAFLTALKNQDITIDQNDPPHVQTAKEMTLEVKAQIISEMEKGRSFDDIYHEIQETTHKERMYERITQEDMRKMIKAGDVEAIRKYVSEMNPVLESKGLKTLHLPSWAQEEVAPQE